MSNLKQNSLYIEPEDLVFFKDAGSFNNGEDDYAESMFPPHPSVFYGALQSIAYNKQEMEAIQSTRSGEIVYPDPNLKIDYLSISIIENGTKNELYPLPDDLLIDIIGGHKKINGALVPTEKFGSADFSLSSEKDLQLLIKHRTISEIDGEPKLNRFETYLDGEGIIQYLNGTLPDKLYNIKEYVTEETRVGLGRDVNTRIAKQGSLYTIQIIRTSSFLENENPRTVGFNISYSSSHEKLQLKEDQKFKLRLGGEKKLAQCYNIGSIKFPAISLNHSDYVKAYFITPGVYTDWKLKQFFKNNGLKVIAIANKRPAHIGGWDMQNKKPKPTYKAIPQGAVYFLLVEDVQKVKNLINNAGFCSVNDLGNSVSEQFDKQGYGIFLLSKTFQFQNKI